MSISRYTLATTLSVAVHVGIFSQFDIQNAFAMPVGNPSTSISLQLVQSSSQPNMNKTEAAQLKDSAVEKAVSDIPQPIEQPKESSVAKPKKNSAQNAPEKVAAKRSVTKPAPPVSPAVKSHQLEKRSPTPNKIAEQKQTLHQKTPSQDPTQMLESNLMAKSKSGVSETPVLIEQPNFLTPPTKPRYPRLAQRRGIEGTATYEIWLDENGQQIKRNLLSSSGADMLDKAALDAIKKWKFTPRTVNGVSMAHRVQIPVRFKLD